jgi:hypothetical protein
MAARYRLGGRPAARRRCARDPHAPSSARSRARRGAGVRSAARSKPVLASSNQKAPVAFRLDEIVRVRVCEVAKLTAVGPNATPFLRGCARAAPRAQESAFNIRFELKPAGRKRLSSFPNRMPDSAIERVLVKHELLRIALREQRATRVGDEHVVRVIKAEWRDDGRTAARFPCLDKRVSHSFSRRRGLILRVEKWQPYTASAELRERAIVLEQTRLHCRIGVRESGAAVPLGGYRHCGCTSKIRCTLSSRDERQATSRN